MNVYIDWLEVQGPEVLESKNPKLQKKFIKEMKLPNDQIKMLNRMVKLFDNFDNASQTLSAWKGILNIFSKPNSEITIPLSKRGINKSLFIFEKKMSVKNIVNFILGLTKNKNIKRNRQSLPKYKTVIKNKLSLKNKNNANFSIDPKSLRNIRIKFAKREKTNRLDKRNSGDFLNEGRIHGFQKEKNPNIAIIPTLLNSIKKGNYSLSKNKFNITSNDILYSKYDRKKIFNIMLVLDTSSSISWVIPNIEMIISSITINISNSKDKLGLITFNNNMAKIYHYPTFNFQQVIGTINNLKPKGKTPLSEGLELALQIFSKEKFKITGMKNLIILISDCFPEPLEGGYKDLLNEPSYKRVIATAQKIREKKVGFGIINPSKDYEKNWGKILAKKCVNITRGRYIEINTLKKKKTVTTKRNIANPQMHEIVQKIQEIKFDI